MNNRKNKNRKKKVALITALLALFAILAGTFAWTSYTEWVKNHMQSKGYEDGRVTIIEEFPNPEIPDPSIGGSLTKKVSVVNTSSFDAFVRISFEEMLHKLAGGADGKGYTDATAAGFPILIKDSDYRNTTLYTDETASLRIYDVEGGVLDTSHTNLKLYVSADGNSGVLVNHITMASLTWPDDFDTSDIPTFTVGGVEYVAQKVTGGVVKQTDGTWRVYTAQYGDDKDLAYWGYGVQVETTAAEADWAGENVHVSVDAPSKQTPVGTPYALGASGISGSNITFTHGAGVGTTLTSDWYYNAADGYFYYTNVLKAGETTTTPVLQSIDFLAGDDTFGIASYNLWVGLEAIPASQASLRAASNEGALAAGTPDWNVDSSNPNKTWTSNNSGWNLSDAALLAHFDPLATIVEP